MLKSVSLVLRFPSVVSARYVISSHVVQTQRIHTEGIRSCENGGNVSKSPKKSRLAVLAEEIDYVRQARAKDILRSQSKQHNSFEMQGNTDVCI